MKDRQQKRPFTRLAWAGVALATIGLAGCGGVPQSDYDAAKKELAAQDQKISALQKQLSTNAVAPPAAAAQTGSSGQAAQGVTTLIGAKVMPTPTLAPPPTAAPPGAPTAAPKVPPASYKDSVGPFTFYVETLATTSLGKDGWSSTVACTPNSVFKRGMKLVWRFEVYDMSTGKRLLGEDNPTIKLKLPSGEEITSRFSQRGGGGVPDAPWMWSAAWDIPLDYPVGSLDFSIDVTSKDGRTGTFKTPALVGSPENDSRVKIIA